MKVVIAAAALAALMGSGLAHAQSQLDHDVQKTWDNVFHPGPRGDARTNWERHQDNARLDEERAAYLRRQEAEHAGYCRYHPGAEGCGRGYGYGGPPPGAYVR